MNDPIKLAIVDDNLFFRQLIITELKKTKEFEVCISVDNGKDLIKMIKKAKPAIVILDLEMPKLNGYETTEYLAKNHPEIKILVLTVHNDPEISRRLILAGANGFLQKKNGIDKLRNALNSVIDHQYYFAGWELKNIIQTKEIRYKKLPYNVSFSERELQVLGLICKQYTNKKIAEILFISKRTVDGHRDQLLKKTNTKTKAGLAIFAEQHGLFITDER